MNIYDTRTLKRRRPRWVRIALWTGGSLFALVLVVVAVVGWWAHDLVNDVGNITPGVNAAKGSLDPQLPISNEPAIALVVGSDFRAGDVAGGSRSDTLMLVRIDPRTKYISLLSLPRDLHVTIPGYGVDKINAAYSDGGYKLALRTVEDDTGVKPNYLVTVDFRGFRDLVDKFTASTCRSTRLLPRERGRPGPVLPGGHPTRLPAAERHRTPGIRALPPHRLRLLPQRPPAGVPERLPQRASSQLHGIGISQLSTLRDVAETVANNVQVTGPDGPPSVQTMIELATTAYAIKDRVITSTLNATVAGDAVDSYVEATPEAMRSAVFGFTHPESMWPPTTLPGKAAGPKVPKFKPKVDPSTTPVTAVNGNGRQGAAASGGAALGTWGYPVTVSTNAGADFDFRQSSSTTGPATSRRPATWPASWAAPWRGRSRPPTRRMPHRPGRGAGQELHRQARTTSAVEEHWRPAVGRDPRQHHLPRPISRPRTAPPTSRCCTRPCARTAPPSTMPWITSPIRSYNIKEAGGGNNSLYAYWGTTARRAPTGGSRRHGSPRRRSWPILTSSERWTAAPTSSTSTAAHIHMVAFIGHGTAYWVQNTLRDDMSNGDMIAIARSLKPVK